MIARGGSRALTIDEISAALYPMAGTFTEHVDKEMTTFTGSIHRDQYPTFFNTVLPQLLDPGFREEDFRRLKAAQLNALDAGSSFRQRRGAWQGAAADQHLPRHTLRPCGARHGRRHQCDHAGRREAVREDNVHRRESDDWRGRRRAWRYGEIPPGPARAAPGRAGGGARDVEGVRPSGIEVEILEKDTRATAISFGFPIG